MFSTIKKGDTLGIVGFTGMFLKAYEVASVTKEGITIEKKRGEKLIFDKTTGIQTNARDARYANKLVLEENIPEQKKRTPKAKKITENLPAKKLKEQILAENKKAVEKKATKKVTAPVAPVIEEDDEDEYEEV